MPSLSYSSDSNPPPDRVLHGLALITTCATFPLIFMGGLVTSHQAGLAVPDWPNSFGYNMFLFPPRLWIGGILYEHTHRLAACAVGLLSIVLAAWAWRSQLVHLARRARGTGFHPVVSSPRGTDFQPVAFTHPPIYRWLALAVLLGVIFQGVLGGLRVVLVNLGLAEIHGCVAQAFFCLVALLAVITSPKWRQLKQSPEQASRGIVLLACTTVCAVYAQLVVGALMRHHQAGLAIPDLPLAYGKILPPANEAQLEAINWMRVRKLDLPAVTLGQVWLHFGHRIGALLVSALIVTLAALVLSRYRNQPQLRRPAIVLLILLAAQITLGVFTVLLRKPADIASAHVAVGALVLLTSFVLAVRSLRLFRAASTTTIQTPGELRAGLLVPA